MRLESAPGPTTTFQRSLEFLTSGIAPGAAVLDVGSGEGVYLAALREQGVWAVGVEIDPRKVIASRAEGFEVHQGAAEALPIAAGSIDVILCSVVLPYTDERRALAEFARVLRPGGRAGVTVHAPGFALECLVRGDLRRRVYGVRMLLNTAWYGLTGRRLPGRLGDTLCQTRRRLIRNAAKTGLRVEAVRVLRRDLGLPAIVGYRLARPG